MAVEGCYLVESDITNWPAGLSDAKKQAIIDKVEGIIDQVTGTHWCAEEFDIELNGNNKNRLFIPLHTDIVAVDLVEISCVELDSSWYTYDKNSILLHPCIGATELWSKNYVTDGKFFYWAVADPTHQLFYWGESIAGSSTINRESLDIQIGSYCCRLDIDDSGSKASIEQSLQLIRNRNFRLQFYYKNTITAKTDLDPRPQADSATATTLRDVDIFTINDEFNGAYVEIVEGTGTDNGLVKITDTIGGATNTITVAAWPGTPPDATSRYIIIGTLRVKLFNPESSKYLKWKIVDEEVVWYWETGDEFFTQDVPQYLFDPTTTWTLFTAEFESLEEFAVYELTFENDGGSSYSIYIDNVGILGAGVAAIPITEDYLFPRGYNNIRVSGTHGESAVPEAIKQAGIILAEWENDPASAAAAGLMKSEKIGDYSYTNLAGAEADVLTGVNKADMLLRHYIKRKAIVMAP